MLSTCRDFNGVIPWTAIERFSERYGIELTLLEDVIEGFEQVRNVIKKQRDDASRQFQDSSETGDNVQSRL